MFPFLLYGDQQSLWSKKYMIYHYNFLTQIFGPKIMFGQQKNVCLIKQFC